MASAFAHLAYRRDANGNISAIADRVTPSKSVLYGYDEVDRLIMTVADSAGTGTETYSYTAGTNQLDSFTDASGTRSYGDTATESRPGGVAVSATYNGFGQLESYDRSNTGLQVYTYNGLDDRVKVVKPTATRHFVYDGDGRVMTEYGLDASDVKAEFIWMNPSLAVTSPFGGGDHIGGYAPLAVATPDAFGAPELRWVHGNHLGVPLVTTNASGSPIAPQNDYMLPGFPGQSMALTDLYYNRYRDYDPVTGRYIQADPLGLGGDVNPYVYALSNPVNYMDPLGLFVPDPKFLPETRNLPKPMFAPSAATSIALIRGLAVLLKEVNDHIACQPKNEWSSLPPIRGSFYDGDERCAKIEDDCKQKCVQDFMGGLLPGVGSDRQGRLRRCIRECMEEQGCYNF